MTAPETPRGRTEELIPMVRKTYGDNVVLYADSNGSYDVKDAIRIGKILEENNYAFYEEPVPFDWYEETKQVALGLTIPIADPERSIVLGSMIPLRVGVSPPPQTAPARLTAFAQPSTRSFDLSSSANHIGLPAAK